MRFRIIYLSVALFSSLSADQKPISQSIVEQLAVFGSSINLSQGQDQNSISIFTPISANQMVGGASRTTSYSHAVQNIIERNCLAYGGDVYFSKTNKFGDTVTAHSFKQEVLSAMGHEERMKFLEIDPTKKDKADPYLVGWDDLRKKIFTDDRLQKSLISDDDYLRPESYYYNNTCEDPKSHRLIYSAHSKKNGDKYNTSYIEITFNESISSDLLKRPTQTKTIEDIYADYIEDKTDKKLLLKFGPLTMLSSNYVKMAKEYCDTLGGSTLIDSHIVGPGEQVNTNPKNKVACIGIDHPFTLKYFNLHYVVSKDTTQDWYSLQTGSLGNTGEVDVEKQFASSVSMMPIGSTAENNIGNRKLVATVYGNNGSNTLVNIQEIGNLSALRNYQVTNGIANDITDPNWTFNSISRLPKKMVDAKKALVSQCSAYGASQLGIDNYTAVCIRQGVGSNCLTNMIYTRGNQFAGKESFQCLINN